MKLTRYQLPSRHEGVAFRAAVVADLHDRPYDKILPLLEAARPDLILIPGDLTEALTPAAAGRPRPGLSLLRHCAAIAPTFYALGNHEIGGCHGAIRRAKRAGTQPSPFILDEGYASEIRESGATLVRGKPIRWGNITLASLESGLLNPGWIPDLSAADALASSPGYRLLLCHHPEYYARYLTGHDIDLIVAGHAHGGQWRLFGRGVYAPDQSLFPKYTGGVHDDRLVISRGVANSVHPIPRLLNPCEVVLLEVGI